MFKSCIFIAIIAFGMASPVPEAKADPKASADPSLIATAYAAPIVEVPVAYPSAYSAPLVYEDYVVPSVYSAGYTAFSPYTGSYIVL